MPELPEVECVKISLEKLLTDRIITGVELRRKDLRYPLDLLMHEKLTDTRILSLRRIGKYLVISLENYELVVHLGMSGRLFITHSEYRLGTHDHIIFYLDNLELLIFNDVRRFGMVFVFPKNNLIQQKIFKNLGLEPLDKKFNKIYLFNICQQRKRISIKNLLMTNNLILGIGNIYANEALFLAKIHPCRMAGTMSIVELEILSKVIKSTLNKAIKSGGTTLRDFVNGSSKPGYFQQQLVIYGKEGKNCINCRQTIIRIIQSGRSSYYCPQCQQLNS